MATATKPVSFFSRLISSAEKFFGGFFSGILGTDEAKTVEAGIVSFVKTDVGKVAVDAVQYASTLVGTSDQLRDAAKVALKNDLAVAGHDVTKLAESTLNLFVEMAFTYVQGTVAALPAAIAV